MGLSRNMTHLVQVDHATWIAHHEFFRAQAGHFSSFFPPFSLYREITAFLLSRHSFACAFPPLEVQDRRTSQAELSMLSFSSCASRPRRQRPQRRARQLQLQCQHRVQHWRNSDHSERRLKQRCNLERRGCLTRKSKLCRGNRSLRHRECTWY